MINRGISPDRLVRNGGLISLEYLVDKAEFKPTKFQDAATRGTPEIRKYFEDLAENGAYHVKVYTSYYGAPAA